MESAFILGVDSELGSALWEGLSAVGIQLEGTTRRQGEINESIQHFDLACGSPLALTANAGVAYLCAAITEMAECEADPVKTHKINVIALVEAARQLRKSGKFIVFLSSSAVFDGAEQLPNEYNNPRPSSEYGRQKAEAEFKLMEIGRIAIVRFTKVVGTNEARILDWRSRLLAGYAVDPYEDLFIAPISLKYAVELLKIVGENRAAGIWHASGDRDVSYSEFAMLLADSLGVERKLVEAKAGKRLTFAPKYAALGMHVTKAKLGLDPQPIGEVISQFVESRGREKKTSEKEL